MEVISNEFCPSPEIHISFFKVANYKCNCNSMHLSIKTFLPLFKERSYYRYWHRFSAIKSTDYIVYRNQVIFIHVSAFHMRGRPAQQHLEGQYVCTQLIKTVTWNPGAAA